MNDTPTDPSRPPGKSARLPQRLILIVILVAALIALFYVEENWRGRREWEKCRQELESKGEVLDWTAYIPAPVPAEQNFMKAPMMEAWFVKQDRKANNPPRYQEFSPVNVPPGSNHTLVEISFQGPATKLSGDVYSLADLLAKPACPLPIILSHIAQVPIFTDPRGAPVIIGGGPDRRLKRVQVSLAAGSQRREFEELVKNSIFSLAPTAESNTVSVVCHQGILADEVLASFTPNESAYKAIDEALKRPYCRFDGDYSDPLAVAIPNFVLVRTVAQESCVRAGAYLSLGQPEAALRELTRIVSLAKCLKNLHPLLVNAMIRVAMIGLYGQTVGEGMAQGLWQAPQLAAIQNQTQTMDLLGDFATAMRGGERAAMIQVIETWKQKPFIRAPGSENERWLDSWAWFFAAMAPNGWLCQNQACIARLHQLVLDAMDVKNQRVFPQKSKEAELVTKQELGKFRIANRLAQIAMPNSVRALQTAVKNQTIMNETMLACALERYYQELGKYPESLAVLTPRFCEKLPHDLIGGEPYKYRLIDKKSYLLYSVGWNEKDDGGLASRDFTFDNGDWVWAFAPAK